MAQPQQPHVQIDQPDPFATREIWERYLHKLKALPRNTLALSEQIELAEGVLAQMSSEKT